MKTKALLIAILLSATNFAWANGGITVDNYAQHIKTNNEVAETNTSQVRSVAINSQVVYPSDIGKPSNGPAFQGSTSYEQSTCNLADLGKPSSGPSNTSKC